MPAYLDTQNILRIHGRIDEAPYIFKNVKRLIILNPKYQITNKIIQFYLEQHHYHFREIIVNYISQKYFITGLRTDLKYVVKHCQVCKNNKIILAIPVIITLPECRLAVLKPAFYNKRIDFFRAYYVEVKRSRDSDMEANNLHE